MSTRLSVCFILLLLPCSCSYWNSHPKAWVSAEEDLVLPAQEVTALDTVTHNGSITFTAAEGATEFNVHVEKRAGGKDDLDAKAAMAELELVTNMEGGRQKVTWRWQDPDKARSMEWQASVTFEITGPPSLETNAKTYNGNLVVTGTNGDARLVTYNGSIDVTHHSGSLDLETYNGRMDIQSQCSDLRMVTYNGSLQADLAEVPALEGTVKTYNGSIRLSISGEPSTRIVASTKNGGIRADKPMAVDYSKKTRFEGTLGEGKDLLNLETYNGSIVIH